MTRAEYGRYRIQDRGDKLMADLQREARAMPPEPHICSVFGCGMTLSPQERLYGSKCQAHSKTSPDRIIRD